MDEKKLLLQEWLIIFIVLSSIFALAAITQIKRKKMHYFLVSETRKVYSSDKNE